MNGAAVALVLAAALAASAALAAEAAPPSAAIVIAVEVDADVGDATAVKAAVVEALARIEARVAPLVGGAAPRHQLPTVRVRRAFALAAHKAAASTPGLTEVRELAAVDAKARALLAHEAAHQFLWSTCPAATQDALFHEAFAVWASDEAPLWLDGEDYLSLPRAREALDKNALDSRAARRALARLIVEEPRAPSALVSRLRACADGARVPRLQVGELAAHTADDVDVTVILQRATGELLLQRGDVERALPYGSTLKPFVLAAARMANKRAPVLAPRATDPMWACHLPVGTRGVDDASALLLSCNGWFLDWGTRDTDVARLGELGPLLLDYGLSALPVDMAQAIGVQATQTISARGLALAYRALSFSRPDVVELLKDNAERGTLAGQTALRGVASKTGTVRGLGSAPDLGWLVALTDDVVVVRARSGVVPQQLVDETAKHLRELPRAARTVAVQTFGLLPAAQVMARCEAGGFVVARHGVERAGAVSSSLEALARRGAALCRAPWSVTLDEERTRPYHGVFTWQPPPSAPGGDASATGATPRQTRARRGSDFVFLTSLGRYTASVLQAEDHEAAGAAREALGRVIAHNVAHPEERHGGRPLCDTTHCQVFLGTGAAPVDGPALLPLASKSFLSFSKGGMQSWRQDRPLVEWHAALRKRAPVAGGELRVLGFARGRVALLARDGSGVAEEAFEIPCEPLRNELRLPSCPARATIDGTRIWFDGVGEGHGVGLDVERAKADAKAGRSAAQLLRDAYGPGVVKLAD